MQKLTKNVDKNEKVVISEKRELKLQDLKEWGMNALKYSSPVLLMIALAVQAGQSWDEIKIAVYALLLQNIINVLTKWSGEQKYVVEKTK